MTRDELAEEYPELLLADGFEAALIGVGTQFNTELAIYDFDKCVSVLMERDGMEEDEAVEFLEFNTTGAWVGNNTPVFLRARVELQESC